MKKNNLGKLLIALAIPLATGCLSAFITKGAQQKFKLINKPPFAPDAVVFPVVWSVLYFLMGISLYLIMRSRANNKKAAYYAFAIQLFLNAIWSIFFFNLDMYLVAFIIVLSLIAAIIAMIMEFNKIDKTAGYLQVPYLLWCVFAAVLNYAIYILN